MSAATRDSDIERAAEAIRSADALLVTAGAGMGVDSGLPDFRGDEGFWRAYPPFKRLGFSFYDLADPTWFEQDPGVAWGFYGHRMHLYRDTQPHGGFAHLLAWGNAMTHRPFVFTSNVDGQFQRAGFPDVDVVECHGSIHHTQCLAVCGRGIEPVGEAVQVHVDPDTFRAATPLPTCDCGAMLRPNILMFGDWGWRGERTEAQHQRMGTWLETIDGARLVVVECGAGTAIPSVRRLSERVFLGRPDTSLIRINPRESHGPDGAISIPLGALDALNRIQALLER